MNLFEEIAASLAIIACFYLSLLFTSSAVPKLIDFTKFRHIIEGYDLLPSPVIPFAAGSMIVVEMSLALLLAVPNARNFSLLVSGALLLFFALVAVVTIIRGNAGVPCGCGLQASTVGFPLVLKNSLIAVIALALAYFTSNLEHDLLQTTVLGLLGFIIFIIEQTAAQLRLNVKNGVEMKRVRRAL